jgi:hypothetical protein
LREALGIAKKDFHELIIGVIKRKRYMTVEAVMVNALDTHMTEGEEMEIDEVFAIMSDPIVEDDETLENSQKEVKITFSTNQKNIEANIYGVKVEVSNEETLKVEVQTFECTSDQYFVKIGEGKTKFDQLFGARATT